MQDPACAQGGELDSKEHREGRSYISRAGCRCVGPWPESPPHENEGHVGVIGVWRSVLGSEFPRTEEIEGSQAEHHMAAPLVEKAVLDALPDRSGRVAPREFGERVSKCDLLAGQERVCNRLRGILYWYPVCMEGTDVEMDVSALDPFDEQMVPAIDPEPAPQSTFTEFPHCCW